ncbi:MAG TPA: phenylalanine--tRNA ligase subunit beta [Mycobacteriales bacterium]|jgi:phenylalanyl-tRNA synthetase beta chain|nr:phenylalanine--tRNA ligase subunit beta [Mycobacteriales bacterium]
MRVPVSWLREYLPIGELVDDSAADRAPGSLSVAELDAALVRAGLEVEAVHHIGADLSGPIVIGEVLEIVELTGFKKPIRHCQVNVGEAAPRSIVCGARNFTVGDWVVVSLPGAVLAGGFDIAARQTYGQLSDGMICATDELGMGSFTHGILLLDRAELADRCSPGDDAVAALGLTDVVFELAVTPDRGYCLSMRGVARELSHMLGIAYTDPADAEVPAATAASPYPVRVEPDTGCDRFAGRVVRRVNAAAPSPWWMRRRLLLSGVRSISLAVDVTNYLMLELGQPMHASDIDTLRGTMLVRRAAPGEKLQTLDGAQRVLDPADIAITDESGPIGLAGVMGGQDTEVSDSTTAVFIESAHWNPAAVSRTARRHRLHSEASKRYERGVDPQLAPVAAQRAVALLTEFGSGIADPAVLDIDSLGPIAAIELDPAMPGRIAGVEYDPAVVRGSLEQIGCAIVAGPTWSVTPPSWRPDLTGPADLVEEVIRLHGYDKIPSVLPPAPASSGLSAPQRRLRSVSRALAEAGYVEVISYPFVSKTVSDDLGLTAEDPRRRACELVNPLDAAEPALRTTLLPGLLRALSRNVARGQRDVALFETGLVYLPEAGAPAAPALSVDRRPSDDEIAALYAAIPPQPRHIAVALAGDRARPGWWGAGEPATWADAIEAARIVAASAGVEIEVRGAEYAPWHPGRCAELIVAGDRLRVIGHAGELHPSVVSALGLPDRTAVAELDLDALPEPAVEPAPALSKFPPVLLDIALVVSEAVPAAVVERALWEGAGPLLESVWLFDVFTGPQVGEERKSLAYALTFRAPDRTLTVEEATAARDAAMTRANETLGAQLRV